MKCKRKSEWNTTWTKSRREGCLLTNLAIMCDRNDVSQHSMFTWTCANRLLFFSLCCKTLYRRILSLMKIRVKWTLKICHIKICAILNKCHGKKLSENWQILHLRCVVVQQSSQQLPVLCFVFLSLTPNHWSSTHFHKLVRAFTCLFPLSLLLPTYPVSVAFSKPSFHLMWPKIFNCFFLIWCMSVLFVSISPKTSSLITWSAHDNLSIRNYK